MLRAAICTLGCKLNQVESEALAAAFTQAGFTLVPWVSGGEADAEDSDAVIAHNEETMPDIIVINTCTVTSKADQKARRLIRKALRDASLFPGKSACVIVTGCYAQLESEAIAALEFQQSFREAGDASAAANTPAGTDNPPAATECPNRGGHVFPGGQDLTYKSRLFVVKGGEKSALLDLPRFISGRASAASGGGCISRQDLRELIAEWNKSREVSDAVFCFAPKDFSFHSRSFLKIQDGCGKHCTYCRVRLARGKSVSLPACQALVQLQALEESGYAEAVLTGVNISQYSDGERGELAELIEYFLSGTRRIALRLSSLEPDFVDERFIAALASPRIRPHFHLSVQSGSAEILQKMGRGYDPQTVERAAVLLRSIKDDPFLACDIITGFPGENEAEFVKTLGLCQKLDFAWIHAFPYSKRPGTPAAVFKGTVSGYDAKRRVETLVQLACSGRQRYVRRWRGREVELLVESGAAPEGGYCHGTSENYLKLLVKHTGQQTPPPGAALRCIVGQFASGGEFDAEAEEIRN